MYNIEGTVALVEEMGEGGLTLCSILFLHEAGSKIWKHEDYLQYVI